MGKAASLYSLITAALGPFVMLHLHGRRMCGIGPAKYGSERQGYASAMRPIGPLVWFHAVSLGEGMEALPLIKKCLLVRPSLNILMTTSTITAFSILEKILPQGVLCQFAPVDTPSAVERFLAYWQPQAAVFMESELWPNLILASSKRGILLALLNARMSPLSFWRWSLSPARGLAEELLSKFSLIAPMNNKEAMRYQNLGVLPLQVHFGGNLKYASGAMDFASIDGPVYHELRRQLLGRRVWLAASTHPGEEKVVVSIHKKLKRMFPNLLTIIAPRHPDRGLSIKHEIREEYPLEVSRRSVKEPITSTTDVYIADTLGELAIFYHLVTMAFVGGSLFEGLQGHNIAEPASAGCAVITGQHVGHFQEMVAEMQRHSALAVEQVSGEDGLYDIVQRLFDNGRFLSIRREAALLASNAAAADIVNRVFKWLNLLVLDKAFGCACQSPSPKF